MCHKIPHTKYRQKEIVLKYIQSIVQGARFEILQLLYNYYITI